MFAGYAGEGKRGENSTFGLNCAGPYDMVILTRNFPAEDLPAAAARAARTGATLCVMNPITVAHAAKRVVGSFGASFDDGR